MGKKKDTLGRTLIKDRFNKTRNRKHVKDESMLHTTELNDGYDWGRLNLQSVTAESSLQEFLSTAELAQREFTAEKLNIKYVKSAPSEVNIVTSQPDFKEPLTVPRRPQWIPGVTAEEQLNKERFAFLEWRKNLTELQAQLGAEVTPYERNLELWKQLWRTLEKSDIVLLLLDARNPLLFRCADLEKYASESNCKCILLLNKADLTSEYHRKCWADYFSKENVSVIFFSAAKTTKDEKAILEDDEPTKEEDSETESDTESEKESDQQDKLKCTEDDIQVFKRQLNLLDEAVTNTADKLDKIFNALDKVVNNLKLGTPIEPVNFNKDSSDENAKKETIEINTDVMKNSYEISDREKLLNILKSYKLERVKNPSRITVGMIGYPNVGKSSTVNVMMQTKKVSVSSMPGHTRHVQSLILDQDIEILDCPGLVLPAYAVTPDLLLTAVLPIDQMRSHDAAMMRLCELVSRSIFEQQFGLLLPDADNSGFTYKQILTAHAFNRGFMTAAGQPDQARSARMFLKQAAAGVLRWGQLPRGCEPPHEDQSGSQVGQKRKPTPREARLVEGWQNKSAEVDKQFFAMNKGTAHVKGKPIIGSPAPQDLMAKPWKHEKKHANKNKREKLRRVYAHLDEH